MHLNQTLIQEFYTDNGASVKLWKGFRLLSKTKYVYKVNNNLFYGFLKIELFTLFFSKTDTDSTLSKLKELLKDTKTNIEPNKNLKIKKIRFDFA